MSSIKPILIIIFFMDSFILKFESFNKFTRFVIKCSTLTSKSEYLSHIKIGINVLF